MSKKQGNNSAALVIMVIIVALAVLLALARTREPAPDFPALSPEETRLYELYEELDASWEDEAERERLKREIDALETALYGPAEGDDDENDENGDHGDD